MSLRSDISNYDYHASEELSRSTADEINRTTPKHVKYRKDHPVPATTAMMIGSCFHSAVLEPMKTDDEFAVKPSEIDGNGPRTNAYKTAMARLEADNPGKTWMNPSDYNTSMEMAGSALDNPVLKEYLSDIDTLIENTGFFSYENTDCKLRMDAFSPSAEVIIDLKSTMDASPKGFASSVRKFNYGFQACWYMEGMRRLGFSPKQFIFVVVEKTPPYATACYTLASSDIVRHREPMRRACELWHSCVSSDIWPGYSDSVETLKLTNDFNRLSMQDIARKFNVGRHFVYRIVESYQLETRNIGNKRTVDINDFADALRWDAEGKSAA